MNFAENPLISIIVPCYNAEKYIHFCVKSILEQSYENWECLLINDGSADKTLSILEEYAGKVNRFELFSQENKGLSATRNLGMDKANGDYVFFLDADDLLTENTLLNLVSELEVNTDIITGIVVTVNGENLTKISQLQHPKEGSILFQNDQQEVLICTMENGLAPVAQNRLFKRSFLERNNLKFKNGILHEDELWFFETMFRAKNIKFINQETYLYRTDNSESITKNVGDRNLESYLIILENIFNHYYKNINDSYTKAVVSRYLNYLKKLIIDFSIREKSKLSAAILIKLQEMLQKTQTFSDGFNVLSKKDEDYYKALNKLSLFPFSVIEKYFFKSPVNSLRKRYKLFKIKYFLK